MEKKLSNLQDAQMDLIELCKELSTRLGLDKNAISYKLYHEGEYDILYVPRFYLTAPCGCCDTLPYIYPTNIADMIEKFKKIIYIDKQIRQQIDELNLMYTIDLLSIFESKSEYIYNDEINDKFWNTDSDEIIKRFIDKWNEPHYIKTLDEYGYEFNKETWTKEFDDGYCQIKIEKDNFMVIYSKNNDDEIKKRYNIDDIEDIVMVIDCIFYLDYKINIS